jgi:hypothetical protein
MKLRKFIKPIILAITATVMALSLAVTALAMDGEVLSFAHTSNEGDFSYGYGYNNVSWKVDVYVSSRTDGTLDPTTDTVVVGNYAGFNDNAMLVGSLLFTNNSFSNLTYIQTDFTTGNRSTKLSQTVIQQTGLPSGGYATNVLYNLPKVETVTASSTKFGKSSTPCYIRQGDLAGLPGDIDLITSRNYIRNIVNTDYFTSHMVDVLEKSMTADGKSLYVTVVQYLSEQIKSEMVKLHNEGKSDEEIAARLYPTSDEPLVEWMIAVCPVMQWNANSGYTNAFWFIADSDYTNMPDDGFIDGVSIPTIKGAVNEKQTITLMLDAYSSAQYNYVTKKSSGMGLFELYGLHDALVKAKVAISDAKMQKWQTNGILRVEYTDSLFENVATASIVNEDTSPYFGIPNGASITDWKDETIADRGGIGIYISKKDTTPSTPVYIHTVTITPPDDTEIPDDPSDQLELIKELIDDPDPDNPPTTTYTVTIGTPVPDGTETYTPTTNVPGLVVAAVTPTKVADPTGTTYSTAQYPSLAATQYVQNLPESRLTQAFLDNSQGM